MFAQVIQGRTKDEAGLRERMEVWDRDLKPGAEGFLGSTAGVSDEGEFLAIARFESEEAARRNSDRREQSEWWEATSKLLEGEARFYDSNEIELMWGGGSDDAGFVQVIQGRLRNEEGKARWREAEAEAEAQMRETRPDLIGGISVWQGLDFSSFVYFRSEEEARKAEAAQEGSQEGTEWMEAIDDLKFIDLRRPFFSSP
ncbi:MAG TPA: hypothetical protein VHK89_10530 [Actinomycetota bacterium]|nr:hypothetical protein [Actinomycetota bacterium]